MKQEQKYMWKLLTITFCSGILAIGLGFAAGISLCMSGEPTNKKMCPQYTVLDSRRVIDCKGDTVFYEWKPKLKK